MVTSSRPDPLPFARRDPSPERVADLPANAEPWTPYTGITEDAIYQRVHDDLAYYDRMLEGDA